MLEILSVIPVTVPVEAPEYGLLQLIPMLIAAAKGGNWALVVGAAVMLLVQAAKPLLEKFKHKEDLKPWYKWVSAGVACVAASAVVLMSGGTWLLALATALVAGPAAVGLHKLVIETLANKLSKKAKEDLKLKKAFKSAVKRGSLSLDELGELKIVQPERPEG